MKKNMTSEVYADINSYMLDYVSSFSEAILQVDHDKLRVAADMLIAAYRGRSAVFVCGNGGSASISDHFGCDHLKGVRSNTDMLPRVVSLACNLPLISAIANDLSYAEVFSYQLQSLAVPGDVLVTVSSSGNSENVVRAIEWARNNSVKTISFTGFSGGRTGTLADINLHVPAENYGVVEDAHQMLMHILAQYIRRSGLTADEIAAISF